MRKNSKEEYIYGVVAGQNSQPVNLEASDVLKKFLDVLRYQSKQRNNLLGRFSSDGKYKIEDEKILNELVLLPKKFDEKVDNKVYASTKIGNFVLNFKMTFDISETYCNANISLIEIEHGIEDDVKHITQLDTFVEPYSPFFKENAYKLWNVYFDADTIVKNDYLFSYLHMQEEEYLFNLELTEILSQLYLVRMLKLLDNSGELGEKIKFEYKLLIEKLINEDPSISQNNTRLKLALDSIISKNNAFKKLLENKEGMLILVGYSAPIQRVKDKSIPVIIREGNVKPLESADKKKDDKKKEEKKPEKKKGKAKSDDKVKTFVLDISKVFPDKKEEKKPVFTPTNDPITPSKTKDNSTKKSAPVVEAPIQTPEISLASPTEDSIYEDAASFTEDLFNELKEDMTHSSEDSIIFEKEDFIASKHDVDASMLNPSNIGGAEPVKTASKNKEKTLGL